MNSGTGIVNPEVRVICNAEQEVFDTVAYLVQTVEDAEKRSRAQSERDVKRDDKIARSVAYVLKLLVSRVVTDSRTEQKLLREEARRSKCVLSVVQDLVEDVERVARWEAQKEADDLADVQAVVSSMVDGVQSRVMQTPTLALALGEGSLYNGLCLSVLWWEDAWVLPHSQTSWIAGKAWGWFPAVVVSVPSGSEPGPRVLGYSSDQNDDLFNTWWAYRSLYVAGWNAGWGLGGASESPYGSGPARQTRRRRYVMSVSRSHEIQGSEVSGNNDSNDGNDRAIYRRRNVHARRRMRRMIRPAPAWHNEAGRPLVGQAACPWIHGVCIVLAKL